MAVVIEPKAAEQFLADQPELVSLSQLASISPSRMSAAFNDPEHFFQHMTLDELERLHASCKRMADFQERLAHALDLLVLEAHRMMQARGPTVTVGGETRSKRRRA